MFKLLGNWFSRRPTVCRPARRLRPFFVPLLESLEERRVLSTWTALGPAPETFAQLNVPPLNDAVGAIQSIAANPTNANIVYIGAVNGGVWKTTNGGTTWTPLTDGLPSQSIGDLAFDLADPTFNTLVAGTGRFSSYGAVGDDEVGLYRTTNGGASWTQLNSASISGKSTTSVVASGSTILAGNDGNLWSGSFTDGLWRSTNTGGSWTHISDGAAGHLPNNAGILDLVTDPSTSGATLRIYAAVLGQGIFRSNDAGATWTNVTANISTVMSQGNMHLAVHNSGLGNVVYLMTLDNTDVLNGVWYSNNQGGAWTQMDTPNIFPGGQGAIHGAISADPTNPNLVYLGGDQVNMVRGDRTFAAGSQFTTIVNAGANNTAPHADTRAITFLPDGTMLSSNDGGIYRNQFPTGIGRWITYNGNLQVGEIHNIAWDSITHTAVAGFQDNGTALENSNGSPTWTLIGFGDGGDVAVDNVTLAASIQSIIYRSSQNLAGFTRDIYDWNNGLVSSTPISLAAIPAAQRQFTTPVVVNAVNPLRILIGGSSTLFESLNQGTTITSLGGPGSNGDFAATPMVYGGFSAGVPNPDLIYVGLNSTVYKRTTSGGPITATTALPGGAGFLTDVDVNPIEYNTVVAVDNNQVFYSVNGGLTWTDITANLTSISSTDFHTVTYINGLSDSAILVTTRSGVFELKVSAVGTSGWFKLSTGLPDVLVYELAFNRADNELVAGTFGRGAWGMSNALFEMDIDRHPPTNLALSNATLPENSGANFPIGTFSTTDPDVGNTFTYALVGGAGSGDNTLFNIFGNTLRETNSLNFEAQSSYSIRVRTTDNTGLFFEKAFTISVTNVNEVPTNLTLSSTSIAENSAPGSTVGTFTTTDPDAASSFTYTFVAGAGSTDNSSFSIVGNSLRAVPSFDFEVKNVYSIRVRTTDQGGLFLEKAFTINVADVVDTSAIGVAAVDPGGTTGPWVKTVNLVTGQLIAQFLAYEPTYNYGVQAVLADMTGDGIMEVVTAPGRLHVPEIRVFTLFGVELTAFRTRAFPSIANFINGVNLAVGDVVDPQNVIAANRRNDILVTPQLGVAEIEVFKNQFGLAADPIVDAPVYRFNAFPTTFVGGATVATGDFNADGFTDIVVGTGATQTSIVKVFNVNPAAPGGLPYVSPVTALGAAPPAPFNANPPTPFAQYANFFPTTFRGVVNVAVGRVNSDLTPDIIVSQGAGGQSLIAVLNGTSGRRQGNGTFAPLTFVVAPFQIYTGAGALAAVYVLPRDVDGDGIVDFLYTSQSSDGKSKGQVNLISTNGTLSAKYVVPLPGSQSFGGFRIG